MKLTDMKIQKKDSDDDSCCIDGGNEYGYGLRLFLDDDRMQKLGYDTPLSAGKEVIIVARGVVETSTESTDKDGKNVSMDIQIKQLSLDTEKPDVADILYNNGEPS